MDVGDLPCSSGRSEGRTVRVGCALLPKKVSRYLTKSMFTVAHSRGVELVLLDHNKPLLDQGEYDAIVHKLRPNKEWERNLQEYIAARPGVKVIDSLAGIRIVHNRATMLLPLRERPDGITLQRPPSSRGSFSVARIQSPTQVEIVEGTSLAEAEALLQRAGLRPPLLVKPLWTDGREGSHGLAVLHDMAALGRVLQGGVCVALKPPLVVQQFVEHGGVLFKVYVLGGRTVVCQRPSLGDSYLSPEARQAGVLSLPRISCKSTYPKGSPEDRLSAGFLYNTLVPTGGTPGASRLSLPRTSGPGLPAHSSGDLDCSGTSWWLPEQDQDPQEGGGGCGEEAAAAAAATAAAGEASRTPAGASSSPPSPGRAHQALHASQQQHQHQHQQAPRPSGPHEQQHERLRRSQPGQGQGQGLWRGREVGPAVPPDWLTSSLASTLRDKLGLQLFNFDMICPEEQPGLPWERLYYVVDINYFPGVDKIPDFEHIFVEFLTAACGAAGAGAANSNGRNGQRSASNGGSGATSGCEVEQQGVGRAGGPGEADDDVEVGAEVEVDCDTDLLMAAAGGGGEDGVSSVSSEKGERFLGADAPAPAAAADVQSEGEDSMQVCR